MKNAFYTVVVSLFTLFMQPLTYAQPVAMPVNKKYSANVSAKRELNIEHRFDAPPDSAKPSCFWWWFNSLVNKPGITRDLEEFKKKGMGGVVLVCSGNDYGVAEMPRGPVFLSTQWMKLFRYALDEAARLGLEVGVNFGGGGWDMGGAWIPPELNSRWFVQSEFNLTGPQLFAGKVPVPDPRSGYKAPHYGNVTHYMTWPKEKMDYRVNSVVAFQATQGSSLEMERLKLLDAKSNRLDGSLFTPAKTVMNAPLIPWVISSDDRPIAISDVIDLKPFLKADGTLEWKIPPGSWTIITTGHVATGADVRCVLPEVGYVLEVDWFSREATDLHFKNLGDTLLKEAGPHAGKTLKYFHTDSFEDGYPNWTDKMINEFKKYRGYDPTPFLPVFTGRIIGNAEISDRFLYDYRKTIADCFANNSYGRFAELSHNQGLGIQCEAAGPSWSGTVCMDGLKNLGRCDNPMGEFWIDGVVKNGQNLVGKQTATASHIYGRKTASAEAFTGGGHWQQYPAMLKPIADRAFCEGINRLVFHTMTSTRPEDGLPGYEYGAGTHFNPNVTWWNQAAGPWLSYINRCQAMLQSGLFVADVLYYNGDWAPNLVEVKHVDPSLGKGYDYDVCNAEVLLTRLSVKEGRIVLPDGMSYRLLVLPDSKFMPVEVIQKIKALVEAGATVVGQKPERDPGLHNFPQCDSVVKKAAAFLWGNRISNLSADKKVGKGHMITGMNLRDLLLSDNLPPDFEAIETDSLTFIDFIHRTTPEAEIYFLANRNDRTEHIRGIFRVRDSEPELWNPMTGEKQKLTGVEKLQGRITVPIEFQSYESMFIVFPKIARGNSQKSIKSFSNLKPFYELTGSWIIQFTKEWLYPLSGLNPDQANGMFTFSSLEDWSQRPEEAVHHYSGTATYKKIFSFDGSAIPQNTKTYLDLGSVRETARVWLNGEDLGVLWFSPFRTEVSGRLKSGANILEIEVVNLWPNRLIGDESLPEEQRKTRTNVITYKSKSPLLPSGLIGPVTLQIHKNL
jgi:hypothetical protein